MFSDHLCAFAKQSRSGGNRGATVEALRGTKGADFEGEAQVRRGGAAVVCGSCFGGGSDDFKTRYLVIKGPFCFVFKEEDATSPSYAIKLCGMTPEHDKDSKTATLRDGVDVQYTMTFDTTDKAARFAVVVRRQASQAETEEIRKELGHGHLLNTRSSVRFAEAVAVKKTKDQPDAPVTTDEILNNMQIATTPL